MRGQAGICFIRLQRHLVARVVEVFAVVTATATAISIPISISIPIPIVISVVAIAILSILAVSGSSAIIGDICYIVPERAHFQASISFSLYLNSLLCLYKASLTSLELHSKKKVGISLDLSLVSVSVVVVYLSSFAETRSNRSTESLQ